MKTFKTILLSLFIITQIACSGDNTSADSTGENISTSSNSSKVVKGKVTVSIEKTGYGKNWMGIEGCLAKFVYTNGMDSEVSVHIKRYEVKHTLENILKTGLASKRTIDPDETRKIDVSFTGFKCDEVLGLEIQAYTCKTAAGADCSDSFNFISNKDAKLTTNVQN